MIMFTLVRNVVLISGVGTGSRSLNARGAELISVMKPTAARSVFIEVRNASW